MRNEAEIDAAINRVLAADSRFVDLVRLAGISPATGFRYGDLTGVSFAGQDLRRFNFTGARLTACQFRNARIAGAVFDGATLDPGSLEQAADWSAYQRDKSSPEAATQLDFPEAMRVFSRLAGKGKVKEKTITEMMRVAPGFTAATRVLETCARTRQRLTPHHFHQFADRMDAVTIDEWLHPFFEGYLSVEDRYSGRALHGASIEFTNLMGQIESIGVSPNHAFQLLFGLATCFEEAMALLAIAGKRFQLPLSAYEKAGRFLDTYQFAWSRTPPKRPHLKSGHMSIHRAIQPFLHDDDK